MFAEGLPERSDKCFGCCFILFWANTILLVSATQALQRRSYLIKIFKSIERDTNGLEHHCALGRHIDVLELSL